MINYKDRMGDVVLENESILNYDKNLERAGNLKDIEPEVSENNISEIFCIIYVA